jgi:hypothetical protein
VLGRLSNAPHRTAVTPDGFVEGSAATSGAVCSRDLATPPSRLPLSTMSALLVTSEFMRPVTRPNFEDSAEVVLVRTSPARARVLPWTVACARTHTRLLWFWS